MTDYQAVLLKKMLDTTPNLPLDLSDAEHWETDTPGDYRYISMARHLYYEAEGSTTITGGN